MRPNQSATVIESPSLIDINTGGILSLSGVEETRVGSHNKISLVANTIELNTTINICHYVTPQNLVCSQKFDKVLVS